MVKRSDHSTSSTDKEVVADQAAKLKAKDAPLGQLQDVLPGTEIGWVATEIEIEGAQLPDVGMQPAADTPQANAAVDSDLSVATDAEANQAHVEQLEDPVTEAAALSPSASSSGIEQVAGASAWLGYGGDEVGEQAREGVAQPSPVGNNFAVTPLPSAGSTPAVNVHVGVDGGTPLGPQTLSMLTASGDTTGQLREDGQQIASGQLSTAGASGAVSWQVDHSAGLYGQLQLSGDGHWRYTLDNASSRVQGLCAGEQVSEHFIAAVTDSAGRTQFIPLSIAIDGSADRAIISGTDVGQANEDKLLLVSGMLTVQDADAGQAQFKPAVLTGSFGLLTLDTVGHWVYELDNSNPAVQALGAGKAATDVLTVTSVDGTTHQVTITVHGSNDQALIVGTHSGAVSEDSLLSVQGRLSVTDIDQGEASFVPQILAGTFGQLQLDTAGHWTYLLDNTNPAVQALGAGAAATDTLTVTTLDGTPQQITITIKGSNDAAQIAGTLTGAVTEESTLIAKGTLTVTDVDQGQARFNPEVFNGQYGSFSLDANGHWLYVLDNSNAAVQRLAAGEQVRDVMTVTSVDGTSCQLLVSVNGSNDAPVLTAQSQTVTEDGARLSGGMVATDVDTGDTHVFSTGTTVAGFMLNADGSYSFNPSNAAYQHLAAGQTQDVVIPVIVTDSAGATSTQNLTITVTGTNDAAVVGGRLTNTLTEDSVVSTAGMLRAGGQLTVVDPDAGEAVFVVEAGVTGAGHYGSFSIDASGHYSYIADNTQAAIQQLKAGETLTDRFTVATADGTQQVVTITINGAEDRPVLHAQTYAVSEDGARLTGQMLATDVDAGDTQRFSIAQQVAGFTMNADGSFNFDPANAAYQHLAAGQTQDVVIAVTVTDSAGATSTQNLTITVTGVNDAAVISGVSNGTITEDQGVNATHSLSCGGKLVVADIDTGEATFAVQHGTGANGYGSFVLGPSGTWTYSADNTQTAIQQLKAGDTLTDTFTVSSTDGTTHTVTVTIQGSNDAPVLTAQTQAVTEDGALLQGRMLATDVDAGDTQAFSTAQAVDGFTLNADGSYSFDPSHASYQYLASGQTQDIVIPVTVTDSTGLSSTQNLTITVTGTNDVAVITSVDAGFVIEDRAVQGGHIKAFGKLGVTDADAGQDHFVAQTDT
ncbi:MAG: VCBS domain-containing protein, partial [Pseudomonadaceae bacterium]|nr:VCBS domain-containing protein [Pseudomonadaceae bacterium]